MKYNVFKLKIRVVGVTLQFVPICRKKVYLQLDGNNNASFYSWTSRLDLYFMYNI